MSRLLLDMTKTVLPLTIGLLAISFLRAQEISPSPSASATRHERFGSVLFRPRSRAKSVSGSITSGVNWCGCYTRKRISMSSPSGPMRSARKWDGKDDYDYDLPAGKYSARGFQVAPMKIGAETTTTDAAAAGAISVRIKLVANPLENNERPTVDICAGFDDDDVYLQTIDGLPLVTVAKRQDAKSVSVAAGATTKA